MRNWRAKSRSSSPKGCVRVRPRSSWPPKDTGQLYIDQLRALHIDIELELAAGTLTVLDAAETLKTLMVGDRPDAERFNRVAGSRIEALCTRGGQWTKVRAFGEMVDLLWRGGNRAAALALEELWSELVARYPVDLLCAYALPGFYDGPHPMEQVCAGHSEVSTAVAVGNAVDPEAGGGVATQMRALAAEIAHRKQVEQMLRGAVRELRQAEKAERERAERNDRLVQELSDTIRVNELFMGVLAHDLRAPLGAIMTAAQLMKIRDTSDSRNAKALGRLLNSGERMSRMIEQLLDFTRLRVGGGIAIETKKGDIATLARQVVDELEGSYPECPVAITLAGDTVGAWDADRLSQVLSNLVANALQHGVPAAGVRVLVDGRAPQAVCVRVHNMGAIPAGMIPHVFDPLTGGQRRRDRSQGLGLGLFISKRIAAAHGGDVHVSSSESEGTTFALSLPRFSDGAASHTNLTTNGPESAQADDAAPRETINLAAMAQDQLRASEARFRLLVEAVKDYAIFMLDPSGRVMTWNAGAQRIKGYEAREIIGRHFSQFYEEEEIRAGKCERELEGATRDGRFEDEGWRVRKDGTRFWANVVITALRGEDGELVGFAKVTRDLTDRRRLEQDQINLARAEEAIRLRDEFLSLAAHELKTPLTVLQLQLDTLHERVDNSGQRVTTKLQRAAQSSERLANLIESLLDVSRIATGRFALAIDEFDIADSVTRVVEGIRPTADKARCELLLETPGPIVGAWDRLRLEQALTNLLSNAIKYGAGKPVKVAVRQRGAEVVLDVRDHGPGIPTPDLNRIFERFERATSIRNYGGLGLGLYLIRAIVDAHGGSVTAENVAEGGARFEVTLPLRTSAEVDDPSTAADFN